ncbi:prostaglandin E2 receptor EP1 subtype [Oryzias melastigma]|uniref:Thromboxane A2 receptor n=1 Tax=Oryzias melastigma TaxID=30732 RepID=A0A3B3D6I8_ORYME|nr:prostaglandin E2 receptor EP1 subtype [Oryzias melastigma]
MSALSLLSPSALLPGLGNSSVEGGGTSHQGNCSSVETSIEGKVLVILSMTLGIISNTVALFILVNAYSTQRRRSKATFLLFATSLVVTDFVGHVVLGALVLRLYFPGNVGPGHFDSSDGTCQFMGGCMVFFGLCPLFMGCAMAAERCLGVTRPLLHSSIVTKTRSKVCLSLIWLAALGVALLPRLQLGSYTYQYPGTWCFINVLHDTSQVDLAFVALFSGLGLTALSAALLCNTVSGLTLVLARLRRQPGSHHSARSHDVEMVVQLVGVMVTSCICWCPLLIIGLTSVIDSYKGSVGDQLCSYKSWMVIGVRMATWNQILDPWVYILLRRTVLRKIYLIAKCQAGLRGSMAGRWENSSLPSLDMNEVNKV